jgi:hypothetical protein
LICVVPEHGGGLHCSCGFVVGTTIGATQRAAPGTSERAAASGPTLTEFKPNTRAKKVGAGGSWGEVLERGVEQSLGRL